MTFFLVTDINANQVYNEDLFKNFYNHGAINGFQRVADAAAADVILFTTLGLNETEILSIAQHPLVKACLPKCYLLCDRDSPYPILPGLYTALPRFRFVRRTKWRRYFRSIFYFAQHNPYIRKFRDEPQAPAYLFSFTGSLTSPVRKRIFRQVFKRDDILIRETRSSSFWENFFWTSGIKETPDNQDYLMAYAKEILKSKFVLCPKGNGISSYRFFEVMEAGRVPVLISDDYELPDIPYDWTDIILRISEHKIHSLEEIIADNEHRYEQMAALNRTVYDNCFLHKGLFIVKMLETLLAQHPIANNREYALFQRYWIGIFSTIYGTKKLIRVAFNRLGQLKTILKPK